MSISSSSEILSSPIQTSVSSSSSYVELPDLPLRNCNRDNNSIDKNSIITTTNNNNSSSSSSSIIIGTIEVSRQARFARNISGDRYISNDSVFWVYDKQEIGFLQNADSNLYSDTIFSFMKERDVKIIYQEIYTLLEFTENLDDAKNTLTLPDLPVFRGENGMQLKKRLLEKGFNNRVMIIRRCQRIRDLHIYFYMTHVPTESEKNYDFFAKIVFLPIMITFISILTPLGGFHRESAAEYNDQAVQIDKLSYLVFQILYCLIAYYPMLQFCILSFIGLVPNFVLFFVMPFVFGSGGIAILYYCLLYLDYPGKHSTASKNEPNVMLQIYGYGTYYQFFYIWLTFLFYILRERHLNEIANSNAKDTSQDAKLIANGRKSEYIPPHTKRLGLGVSSKVIIFFRIIALCVCVCFLYSFLLWFTQYFDQAQNELSFGTYTQVVLLVFFMAVVSVCATVIKGMGNFLDAGLDPEAPSLGLVSGMMADVFIIVYYRNLFAYVERIETFLLFSFVSLIFEAATYQYSVTKHYCNLHNDILNYGIRNIQKPRDDLSICDAIRVWSSYIYCISHGWRDGETFVNKNAVILGYRFIARLSSTIAYVVFAVFLRFGYNQAFYSLNKNFKTDYEFNLLITFIILSFVFECVAMYFPNKYIFDNTGVSIYSRTLSFLKYSPCASIYFISFISAMGHINSDIFVAKIDYQSQAAQL